MSSNITIQGSRTTQVHSQNKCCISNINFYKICTHTGNQHGIAFPSKSPYWWFAFQSGFGGDLFTEGYSSLTSNGSAESLNFTLNFELEHELFPAGTGVEQMENLFISFQRFFLLKNHQNVCDSLGCTLPLFRIQYFSIQLLNVLPLVLQ